MSIYIFKQDYASPDIISLTAAKLHLKVDVTDDDNLITDLIQAAIEAAENYTGTNINEAKYQIKFDEFVDDYEFKLSPVQSITGIAYTKEDGTAGTVTDFELLPVDKHASKLKYKDFAALPTPKEATRIVVSITTGYAVDKVPKAIQSAIKLILGDLYENRDDKVHKMPTRSQSLLRKYRFYY